MHIPDGFLSTPVWAGLSVLSAPAIGVVARKAQNRLDESRLPMIGVMGAFVFAAQMINFPVGLGTSGHLVGSGLLAITLGPAPAAVAMTAILVIQALVFQDGGLLALGANVFNMALAGVIAAWLAYRSFGEGRFRRLGFFAAGFVSVVVGAALCLAELFISGAAMPLSALGIAIIVFAVTATLEGLITLTVLESLEQMNPRWLQQAGGRRNSTTAALALGALLLVSIGVLLASALPDGLERFAGLVGLDQKEQALFRAPVPDYEMLAVANPWLRKASAGLLGLSLTWFTCFLLGRWITRWRSA